jgi:hypothetical protein
MIHPPNKLTVVGVATLAALEFVGLKMRRVAARFLLPALRDGADAPAPRGKRERAGPSRLQSQLGKSGASPWDHDRTPVGS